MITIRAFDGSQEDAEGLLAVERATFNDSPYDAGQIRSMLTDGPQRAWLALAGDSIVGFAVAFATHGLSGPCWEIDLLAVHPDWSGRGLATRLIHVAGSYGADLARRARAVVSTDNDASLRAFKHAGFRPTPETNRLLIYRTHGLSPYPSPDLGVTIREVTGLDEAVAWQIDLPQDRECPGLTLLLAEREGQPAGHAELIQVQTVLYRGLWIESLIASEQRVREALVQRAVSSALNAGLEEIGALVPHSKWPLQQTLLAAGFRSLGDFRWLVAELPLPGLEQQDRV